MKYKVLITGKNDPVVDDFFTQMSDYFEVLSTSIRYEDITGHMKHFVPDVFVCCLDKESQEQIKKIASVKSRLSQIRVPVVVIGAKEDCVKFETDAPRVSHMTLCLPLSANAIQGEILKLIQKVKELKSMAAKTEQSAAPSGSPAPAKSAAPAGSTAPAKSAAPTGSTAPAGSPAPAKSAATAGSPAPAGNTAPAKSIAPAGSTAPAKSAAPAGSPAPAKSAATAGSPAPAKSAAPTGSAAPAGSTAPAGSVAPAKSAAPAGSRRRELSASLINESLSSDEAYEEMLYAMERHLALQEAGITRRKHVLIVDDDSMMLKLMKEYLHEKYDVATALNGKIAMKFLERRSTDLILLDYEMPGENGPAVLEQLRALDETRNIPVVFLTGVTEGSKIQEALALKPQSYLLKPIKREKLLAEIGKVIG